MQDMWVAYGEGDGMQDMEDKEFEIELERG